MSKLGGWARERDFGAAKPRPHSQTDIIGWSQFFWKTNFGSIGWKKSPGASGITNHSFIAAEERESFLTTFFIRQYFPRGRGLASSNYIGDAREVMATLQEVMEGENSHFFSRKWDPNYIFLRTAKTRRRIEEETRGDWANRDEMKKETYWVNLPAKIGSMIESENDRKGR